MVENLRQYQGDCRLAYLIGSASFFGIGSTGMARSLIRELREEVQWNELVSVVADLWTFLIRVLPPCAEWLCGEGTSLFDADGGV